MAEREGFWTGRHPSGWEARGIATTDPLEATLEFRHPDGDNVWIRLLRYDDECLNVKTWESDCWMVPKEAKAELRREFTRAWWKHAAVLGTMSA